MKPDKLNRITIEIFYNSNMDDKEIEEYLKSVIVEKFDATDSFIKILTVDIVK